MEPLTMAILYGIYCIGKCGGIKKAFSSDTSSYTPSPLPFKVTNVVICNVDYSGKIITDYDFEIKSAKSQYLKPKLTIEATTEGTYDIYVKAYNATGNLVTGSTSPDRYSYKDSVSINNRTKEYSLTGWGSSNSGFWKTGKCRFEFYYDDRYLFTKEFFVY